MTRFIAAGSKMTPEPITKVKDVQYNKAFCGLVMKDLRIGVTI